MEQVPRDRLVTNTELVALLDTSFILRDSLTQCCMRSDTTTALQLLAQYFKQRTVPTYFFSPREVEQRIEQFRQSFPEEARHIIRDADQFIMTYGSDVDWRVPGKDRQGRAHTPNTVRLLARQWQAENIALAYYYDHRNTHYIEFLQAHLSDFVHDYERGLTETGGNDIFERFYAGHRTRNWLMAHQLLLGTNDYTWQHQMLWLKTFILHAAKLYDQSKKFNWGNHQLVGLVGLFEVTLMFPEFPILRVWNKQALKLILEHQEKEIENDGFQFERASHYFKLDIINYFHVYRLAQLNHIQPPPVFEQRFHSMFSAIAALAMPNRALPVLQDAQDTYTKPEREADARSGLGTAQSADAAELAEPTEETFMSLGAVLFKDPVYKYFGAKGFPPVFSWYLDSTEEREYINLSAGTPALGSIGLPDSKYYVMRSGWDPNDLYMVIDGGLAHDKPDHTHGGILGVMAYGLGRELLPTYRVRYSSPSYPTMKNSLVKNVALADTLLQGQDWKGNAANTGFGLWRYLPTPTVKQWCAGSAFDYFKGSHTGFDSIGVRYERTIVFLKPDYWLVEDAFVSSGNHSYQQLWQGDFQLNGKKNRAVRTFKSSNFIVQQLEPVKYTLEKKDLAETKSVWFTTKGMGTTKFRTLLLPLSNAEASQFRTSARILSGVDRYTYTYANQTDVMIFGKSAHWKIEGITSDAELVMLRSKKKQEVSLLFSEGTTLRTKDIDFTTHLKVTLEMKRMDANTWSFRLLSDVPESIRISGPHQQVLNVTLLPNKDVTVVLSGK